MSSLAARNAINTTLETLAAPWPVYDLSDYQSLDAVLPAIDSESVLVQYVASDDDMQTIGGEGNQGWEETGTVTIHLVVPTGFASDPTVIKGDEIRTGIRGSRLADGVLVESCSPFVDFGGGLGIDGAWHGWAANLFYSRNDCG